MLKKMTQTGPALLLILLVFASGAAMTALFQPSPADAQRSVDQLTDVEIMPLQIQPGYEGIVLLDRQNRSLCIYQYRNFRPGQTGLALLAARNFSYDVQLDDYNNVDLKPADIRKILEQMAKPGETVILPEDAKEDK